MNSADSLCSAHSFKWQMFQGAKHKFYLRRKTQIRNVSKERRDSAVGHFADCNNTDTEYLKFKIFSYYLKSQQSTFHAFDKSKNLKILNPRLSALLMQFALEVAL